MNRQIWAEHLSSWKNYLLERLSCAEDKGDQIKTDRQLRTIERGWERLKVGGKGDDRG